NPGPHRTAWGGPCTNCAGGDVNGWQKLKIHAPEPVMFGYATTGGIGGQSTVPPPPSGLAGNDHATLSSTVNGLSNKIAATEPFYVAIAVGDTDGNGVRCAVMGSSHTNQLVVTNEGE